MLIVRFKKNCALLKGILKENKKNVEDDRELIARIRGIEP